MIDIQQILRLHHETVERWHSTDIDQPYTGVYGLVCEQHAFNYQLWHEEDIARSPTASDEELASVKRAIDRFNQQRNDWIEKVDQWIVGDLLESRVSPAPDAPRNTETPGSAIDRLSILALRIYHLREQTSRTDVDDAHLRSVNQKIGVALAQRQDLSRSLSELLDDIYAGTKRHGTYHQMKMYNDPTLNPEIYARHRKAG